VQYVKPPFSTLVETSCYYNWYISVEQVDAVVFRFLDSYTPNFPLSLSNSYVFEEEPIIPTSNLPKIIIL